MKRIILNDSNMEAAVLEAATVLREGGVILYPTDTLYGLGADALSDSAVAKVQKIKGREEKKPIHAIVSDTTVGEKYAVFTDAANTLAESFWPGALTLVLQKKDGIATGIAKHIDTFGLRIPNNPFCLTLAREFAGAYTTTSANRSGEESGRTVESILSQLGQAAEDIDLILDDGELPPSKPSTIIDVHGGDPTILREGAIPGADIRKALGKAGA